VAKPGASRLVTATITGGLPGSGGRDCFSVAAFVQHHQQRFASDH
jgi:hypothetical protein